MGGRKEVGVVAVGLGRQLSALVLTYVALIIKLVVGQFEFIKTDHLPHPGIS